MTKTVNLKKNNIKVTLGFYGGWKILSLVCAYLIAKLLTSFMNRRGIFSARLVEHFKQIVAPGWTAASRRCEGFKVPEADTFSKEIKTLLDTMSILKKIKYLLRCPCSPHLALSVPRSVDGKGMPPVQPVSLHELIPPTPSPSTDPVTTVVLNILFYILPRLFKMQKKPLT